MPERRFQFTHTFTKEEPHYTHREKIEKIDAEELDIKVRMERGPKQHQIGTLCIEPIIDGKHLARVCRKGEKSYRQPWYFSAKGATEVIVELDYRAREVGYPITYRFEVIVKSKGRCFIATAAYGSPLHSKLDVLRKFRDNSLNKNSLGKALVKTYYEVSPPFARIITKSKGLRSISRKILNHLVSIIEEKLA